VLLRVPAERGDAVAGADPQPTERRGEPFGAVRDVRERRVPHPFTIEGRDAAVGMDAAPVVEQRGDGEGEVLHRAEHDVAPTRPAAGTACAGSRRTHGPAVSAAAPSASAPRRCRRASYAPAPRG